MSRLIRLLIAGRGWLRFSPRARRDPPEPAVAYVTSWETYETKLKSKNKSKKIQLKLQTYEMGAGISNFQNRRKSYCPQVFSYSHPFTPSCISANRQTQRTLIHAARQRARKRLKMWRCRSNVACACVHHLFGIVILVPEATIEQNQHRTERRNKNKSYVIKTFISTWVVAHIFFRPQSLAVLPPTVHVVRRDHLDECLLRIQDEILANSIYLFYFGTVLGT